MTDSLYSKDLLRLAAAATGAGRLDDADATYTERNPACGDSCAVELKLADGRIAALAHDTKACVLAQGSAAILAEYAAGATARDLEALKTAIETMLDGGEAPNAPFADYATMRAVAALPGRHTCVLLPIEAAIKAMATLKAR